MLLFYPDGKRSSSEHNINPGAVPPAHHPAIMPAPGPVAAAAPGAALQLAAPAPPADRAGAVAAPRDRAAPAAPGPAAAAPPGQPAAGAARQAAVIMPAPAQPVAAQPAAGQAAAAQANNEYCALFVALIGETGGQGWALCRWLCPEQPRLESHACCWQIPSQGRFLPEVLHAGSLSPVLNAQGGSK